MTYITIEKEKLDLALNALTPFANDADGIHSDWANERRRSSLTQERHLTVGDFRKAKEALITLTEALAQPEQEPVAYGMWDSMIGCGGRMMSVRLDKGQDGCTVPLYTIPPQRKLLTDELNKLRKALVYVAHALHATPQYMLAKGIALIDGDTVQVSIDGYVVEASDKTIEAAHGIKE